jgi:sugar lactone lactonase YvrE
LRFYSYSFCVCGMAAQTFFFACKPLQYAAVSAALCAGLAGPPAKAQTNFGSVNIGASTSANVTLTIPAAATLGSISVVTQGASGLDFVNGGAGSCSVGGTYTTGQTCTVQVNFVPVYPGERYGAVSLADPSGNLIASALLEGNGVGPQIAFGPGAPIAIAPMVDGIALHNPFGVAIDGAANLYFADSMNSRVVEVPAGGGPPVAVDPIVNGAGLSNPGGVAVDAAGNLYISDLDRDFVVEVPANGAAPVVLNPTVNGLGLRYPCGMVFDAAGDLYIADVDNARVVEIPAGGAPTAIDPLVAGAKLSYPVTLAIDAAGDLFIADLFANRVVELPAGGGTPSAIDPVINGQGLDFPYGIAVDAADNLYIADANNRIVLVPPNGGAPSQFVPTANGVSINDPIGIALTAAGDLYIGDSLKNRVVEVVRSQPPAINFAAASIGSVSSDSPKSVTLENIGNASLTIPAPQSGSNPAVSSSFTLNSGAAGACPVVASGASQPGTLAAGASCQLDISFQPAVSGAVYGTLTVTDNTLNAAAPSYATQTIALSGDAPVASLSAASLSFGPQQVGMASASQQVALTNSGSAPLAISSIAVVGAPASVFVFPNPCPSSLAAGANCVISGHFTPGGAGLAVAKIAIADNAPNSPQIVALTGAGVYATTVTVDPAQSTITTSQPLQVAVTVAGPGGDAAPTGSVILSSGSYASGAVNLTAGNATITVPAGSLAAGTDTLTAVYTPDSASSQSYSAGSGESSVDVTASPTATAPAATTGPATNVSASSAVLAATVNPNGADTHVMFLYGTSSNLSSASQTPSQDIGAASGTDAVTANLTGLNAATTYYYQAVAENSAGTTSGSIFSFTTIPTPYFSLITGAPLSLEPGATTGNTSQVAVTPWYNFTGTVNLACAIAPAAANDPPTCSISPSVAISGADAVNATVTISTTAASTQSRLAPSRSPYPVAAVMACILLFVIPVRGRRRLAIFLCSLLLFAVASCGGGGASTGSSGPPPNPGTSPGLYTVTISGVSGSLTETGTVALTVQ